MINGLEGIPGSGKSYEAVVYHVLHALQSGRRVITNLPLQVAKFAAINPEYEALIELRHQSSKVLGTWDATRVDDKGNGSAFEVAGEPQLPLNDNGVFGSVWDYYSAWKHPETGQGPLFLIDECHVAMPVTGTDPAVVQWYKLHRHFNCDVLLATQNFRDMNQPIARLIAMLVKVRSADILGSKGEYIRKVHAGYRGAVISTEVRKYKPEFFGLYKSHSQGNSVAESSAADVKPFLVKFKRFTRVFVVVTLAYSSWAAYRWFTTPSKLLPPIANTETRKPGGPLVPASGPSPAALPTGDPATQPVDTSQKMVPMADDEIPEPYASKGLHITGVMSKRGSTVYTFALSSGSTRLFSFVTSEDLKKIGYVFQPLTDCAGTLRWRGSAKTVTCDAPAMTEGSASAPVVITLPAGSSTPTARSGRPLAVW